MGYAIALEATDGGRCPLATDRVLSTLSAPFYLHFLIQHLAVLVVSAVAALRWLGWSKGSAAGWHRVTMTRGALLIAEYVWAVFAGQIGVHHFALPFICTALLELVLFNPLSAEPNAEDGAKLIWMLMIATAIGQGFHFGANFEAPTTAFDLFIWGALLVALFQCWFAWTRPIGQLVGGLERSVWFAGVGVCLYGIIAWIRDSGGVSTVRYWLVIPLIVALSVSRRYYGWPGVVPLYTTPGVSISFASLRSGARVGWPRPLSWAQTVWGFTLVWAIYRITEAGRFENEAAWLFGACALSLYALWQRPDGGPVPVAALAIWATATAGALVLRQMSEFHGILGLWSWPFELTLVGVAVC